MITVILIAAAFCLGTWLGIFAMVVVRLGKTAEAELDAEFQELKRQVAACVWYQDGAVYRYHSGLRQRLELLGIRPQLLNKKEKS